MTFKKILAAALVCLPFLGAGAKTIELQPDQKLRMAAALIENYYVDEVDGGKVAEEAIEAFKDVL